MTPEGGVSRPLLFGGGRRLPRRAVALALLMILPAAGRGEAIADAPPPKLVGTLRFATWNVSLNRNAPGALERELAGGRSAQALTIAAALRRVRPDVLLLNEFDHDAAGRAAALFHDLYLAGTRADIDARPLSYRVRFSAPVNTGLRSGFDLDRDGRRDGPGDALGFGRFPGQYGMVVYSRLPIDTRRVRTFQMLRWREMPGALLPPGWYPPAAEAILPLSSKSHWDLPISIGAGRRIHLLASHPTPPAFDGDEDRNGRRNHDEIRFWVDYLDPERAAWIRDDAGRAGGLAVDADFVIAGDLNADPQDGGSHPAAIAQLLAQARVRAEPVPRSRGAELAAARQGGINLAQRGAAAEDTADFGDAPPGPGNLRVDYVLPSRSLAICASGVYWPAEDDALARASDHRLVWVDLSKGRCPQRARPQRSGSETPTAQ
jgi:hypothetical protein